MRTGQLIALVEGSGGRVPQVSQSTRTGGTNDICLHGRVDHPLLPTLLCFLGAERQSATPCGRGNLERDQRSIFRLIYWLLVSRWLRQAPTYLAPPAARHYPRSRFEAKTELDSPEDEGSDHVEVEERS
jgi:hypothetical protein